MLLQMYSAQASGSQAARVWTAEEDAQMFPLLCTMYRWSGGKYVSLHEANMRQEIEKQPFDAADVIKFKIGLKHLRDSGVSAEDMTQYSARVSDWLEWDGASKVHFFDRGLVGAASNFRHSEREKPASTAGEASASAAGAPSIARMSAAHDGQASSAGSGKKVRHFSNSRCGISNSIRLFAYTCPFAH